MCQEAIFHQEGKKKSLPRERYSSIPNRQSPITLLFTPDHETAVLCVLAIKRIRFINGQREDNHRVLPFLAAMVN